MKKLMLILILSVLMISFTSAFLGTIKENECVNIKTILNTTSVNISSISYPNSTIIITEQPMTKVGHTFNYSFCNTNTIGIYIYDYYDSEGNVYVNDFEITSTGKSSNNKIPIYLLISGLVLLILGYLFESPPIGFFSGILFILVGTFLMIYGFENITDLYTRGFALVIIGFGMTISFLAGYSWLDEY